MASMGCPPALLQFQLPQTPLLSGCTNFSEEFFATLTAQGICSPLPTLSFASPKPARSPCLSPSARPYRRQLSSRRYQEKPFPAVPTPSIPPKQIIALLNLLDRMDDDTARDVHRVREAIKEVRSDIAEARAELKAGKERIAEHCAKLKRETKGVDDDFWLNAEQLFLNHVYVLFPILGVNTGSIRDLQASAENPTPKPQPKRRQSSIDPATADALEKRLTHRPEKHDLIDRNILKDDKVAPSLQAARDQLQKSQLQDKLDQALLQRPKKEELIQGGILKPDTPEPAAA
ncbi:hypothetical protein NM688_g5379 [Phlebia brevispora]|uniref:Uncharacterized protein n=1 Tax=Phlebia brevispora TaxID=194682 RepID=A0ACC1SWH7_9APHY|nr:hypothetical protein NM688_g5379 [Phlebia brevispora]